SLPEIQTKFVDVNEQVTPKIEVNLRLLPSVTNPKAKIVATVKNGEVFTRTGSNDELGWSRVEYKGQVLYCISSYVEVVSSAADAQPAAENNPQDAAAPAA
ncbi:MAG TPA: glycoside hydrolase family 25, partial [Lachnospiraceae bacterium]|nr:glycoside hydrolase family 25 [Lachnospiraceae bacterium]